MLAWSVVGEGAVRFERGRGTQTQHIAVAGQRKPLRLDVDDLSQRIVDVVVVHEAQLDGLFAVVDVERLVDVALGVGRDDLALDDDVVLDHHTAAETVGVMAPFLVEFRFQVLDRNDLGARLREVLVRVDLCRRRIVEIVVATGQNDSDGERQGYFQDVVHNSCSLIRLFSCAISRLGISRTSFGSALGLTKWSAVRNGNRRSGNRSSRTCRNISDRTVRRRSPDWCSTRRP